MKLFAALYAADYTVRKMAVMHDLKKAFLPMFGAMAFVGVLLLKEPISAPSSSSPRSPWASSSWAACARGCSRS